MTTNIANTKPQANGVHPEVREFFETASERWHERDELLSTVTDLRNSLAIAEGTITHLRAMLEKITDDRDFHMQHAFALASGINSAQDVLNGVFELAKRQAASPAQLPRATQLEVQGE